MTTPPRPSPATGRVLVTVGSDHHPFQRLVSWSDDFARANPQVQVTIQYGSAQPPSVARGHAYLEHAQLQALMGEADAIVVQGGPTGMIEARRHGRLPIVVARRHALNEHVDDHQVSFSAFLAASGQSLVASTQSQLHAMLDEILSDPTRFTVAPDSDAVAVRASVERFGLLVADLRTTPRWWSRRRRQTAPALSSVGTTRSGGAS